MAIRMCLIILQEIDEACSSLTSKYIESCTACNTTIWRYAGK
jgi:hypothetical protein